MNIPKIKFQIHGDDRGSLVALEENKEIPFSIKRVYYIFETKEEVVRGHHAHKSLEQIFICVSGQCKIRLNNGKEMGEVLLDNPEEGIYVAPGMWREMYDFSEDAVLLVLASELYHEEDYIRNYDDFLAYINQK